MANATVITSGGTDYQVKDAQARQTASVINNALGHMVGRDDVPWTKADMTGTSVGDIVRIGTANNDATQICCEVPVPPGSYVRRVSVTSGFVLHYIEADKDGHNISGWVHSPENARWLAPNCEKLFVVITNTAYSSAITVADSNKVEWYIGSPFQYTNMKVGYIETSGWSIVAVDTAGGEFSIKRRGYTAIRYGEDQKIIINDDVSITGNFNDRPYLIFNLKTSEFEFTLGGYESASYTYSTDYLFIGYCWDKDIKINCFPFYFVDNKKIVAPPVSFEKYHKVNENNIMGGWTKGNISNAGAGNIPTIIEDVSGGTQIWCSQLCGTGATVNIKSIASGYLFHILQLDKDGRSVVGWKLNNAVGRVPLNPACVLVYVVITRSDWTTQISTSDYNKADWEIYDTQARSMNLAFVGDSISTYKGISPNLNGGGHYPNSVVTSQEQMYMYIAAAKAGVSVNCLQAVSQSTIKYQVTSGEDRYGWADSWVNNVQTANPDVIVINLGINDAFGSITGDVHVLTTLAEFDAVKNTDTYGAYQYMITKYQNACPRALIVCVIPNIATPSNTGYATNYDAVCNLIEKCAKYHGCNIVDFRNTLSNRVNISTFTEDKIHPNVAGMRLIGELLGERLIEISKQLNI